MAILLVKVATNDRVPPGPGQWQAGEIVWAFETGHVFGAQELPEAGNFYHITITNRTLAQVAQYFREWRHEPTSDIIDNNGEGGYRVRITSTAVSASGKNAITRAKMDGFVTRWGGVYASHTNASYTFDITSFWAATSEGFYGPGVDGITFANEGFTDGWQQVGITDRGSFSRGQIVRAVESRGGTIIDQDSYIIPASTVYDEFKADIEDQWRALLYKRRRWQVTPAGMAALAGAGGAISAPAATVAGYLSDGFAS